MMMRKRKSSSVSVVGFYASHSIPDTQKLKRSFNFVGITRGRIDSTLQPFYAIYYCKQLLKKAYLFIFPHNNMAFTTTCIDLVETETCVLLLRKTYKDTTPILLDNLLNTFTTFPNFLLFSFAFIKNTF